MTLKIKVGTLTLTESRDESIPQDFAAWPVPTASAVKEATVIKEGRIRDAMRWVAQEANTLLFTGKIDGRYTSRLRSAIDQLDIAYALPEQDFAAALREGRIRDALRWVTQEAKGLLLTGKIDERYTARMRSAFDQLDIAYALPED